MSDLKSSSSSKGSSKSSKEPTEHAQLSRRSQSDPATSNAMPRSFSEPYNSFSGATDRVATEKDLSPQPWEPDTTDDYDEEYESEEDQKPTATKGNSSQSQKNVYTECGRHSNKWLVKPAIDAVKSAFKK
jgi:hypothetical protein